ncbi:hypothetical protein EVAR_103248_1 [Eumeta japonica]|uniref:Uncharacterized protein n=1 Tax=Eumeta variegata TaxID=151549 RepID=A0A4C1ZZ53_EUMVA|nr:hypothetical protein EVAR_103248_1 [Eumeta japonica]
MKEHQRHEDTPYGRAFLHMATEERARRVPPGRPPLRAASIESGAIIELRRDGGHKYIVKPASQLRSRIATKTGTVIEIRIENIVKVW